MLLLVMIIYMAMAAYEFIPLYKQKQWNDLRVNSVLFFSSFIVAVLLCLRVNIPSPVKPIRDVIISVFGK